MSDHVTQSRPVEIMAKTWIQIIQKDLGLELLRATELRKVVRNLKKKKKKQSREQKKKQSRERDTMS